MDTNDAVQTPEDRGRQVLATAGYPLDVSLVPPPPAHAGEPVASVEDPTAGGYYCGAIRSRNQLTQDYEDGVTQPWPWCRMRAGRGTDHVGTGSCRNHGGSTRNGRLSARLRLAELVQPAMATLARALTDPEVPWSVKQRAADSLLDRAGYPRRLDVDVDAQREGLVDRLWALQQSDEDTEDDET